MLGDYRRRGSTVDLEEIARRRGLRRRGGVLIGDLADERLEEVFERHDTRRAAEFIDHDREVLPFTLHIEEYVAGRTQLRRERYLPQRERVANLILEQVERVDHADDLIERGAIHRHARVSALGEHRFDLSVSRVLRDGHHVGPRRHHGAHRSCGEGHHAAHHHQLFATDTGRGPLARKGANVIARIGVARRKHHAEECGPPGQHRLQMIHDTFGSGHREPAWQQVAAEQCDWNAHENDHEPEGPRRGTIEEPGNRRAEECDTERCRRSRSDHLAFRRRQPPE